MNGNFRTDSNDNTLFTTARCNNNCIMCCEPPHKYDDVDELFVHNLAIIDRAPKDIDVVGISGGEPSLLGNRLIELIKYIRYKLPDTDIHLLSNGRLFKDADYAKRVVDAAEGRLQAGIPLHSDYYRDHDIIAGAKGAFGETIAGICNLAGFGAAVELRVVIQKMNYMRLGAMAEFISRNLPFVAWTAFMGLEYVGRVVVNEKDVWVEPLNYVVNLSDAVIGMAQMGHDVAIYNVPLCLLPERIHQYACKSISDWKNKYLSECDVCRLKVACCGFFATSGKTFQGIISQ